MQYRVSFGKLGTELRHLLEDIKVGPEHLEVLNNPASVRKGSSYTETDIEVIMNAGREMKHALDRARKSGSVHLQAMFEKVKVSWEYTRYSVVDAVCLHSITFLFCRSSYRNRSI